MNKKENRLYHLIFLQILKTFVWSKIQTISKTLIKKKNTDWEGLRMAKVFQVVMDKFYPDIKLKEVSEIANITPNAFCKYFKRHTKTTYFQFLPKMRIENY